MPVEGANEKNLRLTVKQPRHDKGRNHSIDQSQQQPKARPADAKALGGVVRDFPGAEQFDAEEAEQEMAGRYIRSSERFQNGCGGGAEEREREKPVGNKGRAQEKAAYAYGHGDQTDQFHCHAFARIAVDSPIALPALCDGPISRMALLRMDVKVKGHLIFVSTSGWRIYRPIVEFESTGLAAYSEPSSTNRSFMVKRDTFMGPLFFPPA